MLLNLSLLYEKQSSYQVTENYRPPTLAIFCTQGLKD